MPSRQRKPPAKKDRARSNRVSHLKNTYGITPEEYQALVDKQHGLCGICKSPPNPTRRLAVDVIYGTKKIRGLICVRCNRAIGMLRDDPGLLGAAITYLLRGYEALSAE